MTHAVRRLVLASMLGMALVGQGAAARGAETEPARLGGVLAPSREEADPVLLPGRGGGMLVWFIDVQAGQTLRVGANPAADTPPRPMPDIEIVHVTPEPNVVVRRFRPWSDQRAIWNPRVALVDLPAGRYRIRVRNRQPTPGLVLVWGYVQTPNR